MAKLESSLKPFLELNSLGYFCVLCNGQQRGELFQGLKRGFWKKDTEPIECFASIQI